MVKYYYVYILQCSDQKLYTGITNNIERRLSEHQQGLNKNCFTYARRPVQLRWHEIFLDPEEAIRFEKKIKKWSKAKKMALIHNNYDLLPRLSQNKRNREKH